MKLIQKNGQPRYGRFDQIPSQINLDDYIYKTPYGQVLKGWRKQLKYKNLNSVVYNMSITALVLRLSIYHGQGMVFSMFMIIFLKSNRMECDSAISVENPTR